MAVATEDVRGAAKPALPLDVYGSLVDALYDVRMSVFTGALAASLAGRPTACKTGDAAAVRFDLAIGATAGIRALDMRQYEKIRPTLSTTDAFREWENRYVYGAALHVALLGGWTFVAFARTDDPFIHLFSFAVTFAYLIGIAGRN